MLPGELLVESQKLSYRAALLAPMMIRTGTYAALFLLFQDTTVIAPQHYQLIRGICNQLSVTIQNSQLWEELRHKEQIRTLLLHKLVSAQEAERQRISRELHDETGQALTSLLVQLKILEKCSTLTDVQEQVQGIRKLTAQTLQEVRRLAAHLRPSALDDLGLISALEGYIYDYAGKSGITVDFQHHNVEEVRLPHDMEIVLYRVVQESLTNVLRHAQASQVQVMIRREYKSIQLSVVDNGRGFDVAHVLADKERGLGLLGMQERIELLGGTLVLDSTPGHGSRVEIDLTMPDGVLQKDAR
jgi:signal transduction histidine kinase